MTDWVQAIAVVIALGFSGVQTWRLVTDARKRDRERRIERALEFYRDLVVDGDTANSFNRLSVVLRKVGADRVGIATWHVPEESDFHQGNVLDPARPEVDLAFQDLYRILWFWERVEGAWTENLVDRDVLFRSVGYHCWWWDQLLWKVTSPKAAGALHRLAASVTLWAKEEQAVNVPDSTEFADWVSRCPNDFDGEGPRIRTIPPDDVDAG